MSTLQSDRYIQEAVDLTFKFEQISTEIELLQDKRVQYQEHLRKTLDILFPTLTIEEVNTIVSELYWNSSFAAGVVKQAFFNHSDIPFPKVKKEFDLQCKLCGINISRMFNSWSKIKNIDPLPTKEGYKDLYCDDCREEVKNRNLSESLERNIKYEQRRQEEKDRLHELKIMPYQDYLKTEHWKQFRVGALKRHSFRCQLCNRNDIKLDIHHRTYERRGCEQWNDVIALCRLCHGKFHDKLLIEE